MDKAPSTADGGESSSPAQIASLLLSRLDAQQFDDIATLYGPDAIVDLPFAPMRLVGRAAIAAHMKRAAAGPLKIRVLSKEVITTNFAKLVVLRSRYRVTNRVTENSEECENVQLLEVENGLIVRSTDFHDHQLFSRLAAGVA